MILMTFKRTSKPVVVRFYEDSVSKGLKYNIITLLFGWWGFPAGPVLTLASLLHNFRGGTDCTRKIADQIGYKLEETAAKKESDNKKEISEAIKMARYSKILGISTIGTSFIGASLGIVFGHRALKILKTTNNQKDIRNARTGLIFSYSYCAIATVAVIVLNILER